MGLVKKSRGRRVADVPNPLAEPPLPDTVFLGQESSSVPPWDLGETERDRRSDSGDAAKMSVTSFDYGWVYTRTALFLVDADPPFR